jgi:hypothetical protein
VEAHAPNPAQDLTRRPPAVPAPLVRVVALVVVVRDDPGVGLDEFRPAFGLAAEEGLARLAVTRLFLDRTPAREEDSAFSGKGVQVVLDYDDSNEAE